jgi:Domain of unknown function DUF302
VLTEIDVRATLRDKLGEEIEDYLILGACNPPLAHRALQTDWRIGLPLPCNVVVRTDRHETVVEALDPQVMVGVSGNPRSSRSPTTRPAAWPPRWTRWVPDQPPSLRWRRRNQRCRLP